jgi:plastocyanin
MTSAQPSGLRSRVLLVSVVALVALVTLPIASGSRTTLRQATVTVRVTIHGHPVTVQNGGIITFVPDKVKAGTKVIFKITNTDIRGHNFLIDGHQTREMGAKRGQAILRLTFAKPGQYSGSCPDDNHSGIGGVFVVT